MSDDYALSFLPEEPSAAPTGPLWKVLVVDDDEEVLHVTRLVLQDFSFRGRRVEVLSAASAQAACQTLAANPDMAVILLDVVMETDDAGLRLVSHIRETLGLTAVRIILRTGQPGQAPERDVILRYDINDYKAKTELTAQKLLTATIAALRSFEGIKALEDSHRLLQDNNAVLEQRVAERTAALQASEARYRALIEAVPEGVVTAGEDGVIRSFSVAAEQVFGWAAREIVGRPLSLLSPPVAPLGQVEITAALTTHPPNLGEVGVSEMWGMRRDGSVFPLEVSVNVEDIGTERLRVMVMRDISPRHAMIADLHRAREEAEAAARAKAEFLAVMSHEVRTPLNGILGTASLLLGEDPPLPDPHRLGLETIDRSGRALLAILDDVLDYSRLEAGRMDLACDPFSPSGLVGEVIDLMQGRAKEKSLILESRIGAGLPPMVRGDSGRLRQVLLNLVSNGIKFTERGRVTVSVSGCPTAASSPGAEGDRVVLRFSVVDTGIGIAREVRAKLFDHFVQADSSISRRYGGSGLGLAICHRLVGLMDGEIGVDSVPGRGSTFWVQIALPQALEGEDTAAFIQSLEALDRHLGQAQSRALLRVLESDLRAFVRGAVVQGAVVQGHEAQAVHETATVAHSLGLTDLAALLTALLTDLGQGEDAPAREDGLTQVRHRLAALEAYLSRS